MRKVTLKLKRPYYFRTSDRCVFFYWLSWTELDPTSFGTRTFHSSAILRLIFAQYSLGLVIASFLSLSNSLSNLQSKRKNFAGQLAAMIFAAQRIVKELPNYAENIGLLLVVSEELDHGGMLVRFSSM